MAEHDAECTGFFSPAAEGTTACLDAFKEDGALQWIAGHFFEAPFNIFFALADPGAWLGWLADFSTPEAKQSLMRFIYYGASAELFFVILLALLVLTGLGLWKRAIMWGSVRVLEGFANGVGRFFAWAGLLMVLQQIVIVFSQRIFAASNLTFGFGSAMTFDLSWYAEELKLYNALIVALCCAYTFVQGGHVRVDLLYAPAKYRTKKIIDMFGAVFFMMPFAVLVWLYGWFFLWRVLVVPNPSVSDTLDSLLMKARALRWNVETIGFSPNGFNAYFLFKVLLVTFTAMVFLQAIAVFYRSYLELVEGPESDGKYLDRDTLGAGEEAYEGTH
ncbi:C4-dicarboxylate ABC transporter permease [Maribius pontilimi]|uniref:TRAP transporter small permease protein n=1 Tax=Palleronia pontilimi TaxID=1964209 RepID=A0A934IC55_9RHOB|nr:TRAP transporter small permease subunit [Palleronia pontilimi]MBJ3761752.1 C4-dicarboxylate ABC transporter permease [Palleronia pontilimi]